MKPTLLLAAILFSVSITRGQVYEEQRPSPPLPAPVAADDSNSFSPDTDADCSLTVPLQIAPESSTISAGSVPAPAEPAVISAHGNINWVPSTYQNYNHAVNQARRQQSAPHPGSQGPVSSGISDQFRNLILEKRAASQNSANPGIQSQAQLNGHTVSLGDLARQVREQRANSEKPRMAMKQDAQGHAVLVTRTQ
jgi:hypothetical protein